MSVRRHCDRCEARVAEHRPQITVVRIQEWNTNKVRESASIGDAFELCDACTTVVRDALAGAKGGVSMGSLELKTLLAREADDIAKERAAVVAWLRESAHDFPIGDVRTSLLAHADQLERGEHVTGGG